MILITKTNNQTRHSGGPSDRIIPGVVQLDTILERLLQRSSFEPLEHQERGPHSLLDVEARPERPRHVGVPVPPGTLSPLVVRFLLLSLECLVCVCVTHIITVRGPRSYTQYYRRLQIRYMVC